MRILVTGGNGMLGKSLVPMLRDRGHYVVAPNRVHMDLLDLSHCSIIGTGSVYDNLDYMIHCAALVGGIEDNINRCYDYLSENSIMNLNAVNLAIDNKIPRFLGILSTCVYPDSKFDLHERQLHDGLPHETNFGYAYSKRLLAKAIDLSNKQYGTKYTWICPSNLYGINDHRDERAHFVSKLCERVVKAKKENASELVFHGFPNPIRQYLYVDDLADIIVKHVENDIQENYNVAYPIAMTIDEMVNSACKVAGINPEIKYTREIGGQDRRIASIDMFHKIYPQYYFTPFKQGIKNVIEAWSKE